MSADDLKRAAALAAVALVESGMTVGLGTGSTAVHAINEIGRRLASGELTGVRGVPTSLQTSEQAVLAGVPLTDLSAAGVDVAIDGCDEVDPELRAIKGLGGALTREKIVAASARHFVLIADDSKAVPQLGQSSPVPVEVLPFGWQRTESLLRELAAEVSVRGGSDPLLSDNGNLIFDLTPHLGFHPASLAESLKLLPGVIEHGLFLSEAHSAILAGQGGIRRLERSA